MFEFAAEITSVVNFPTPKEASFRMSFRKRMPALTAGAFLALSPVLVAAQPASALSAEEQYLVDSVNAARAAQGLAPLTYSEQLSVLSQRHSVEMSNAGSLFHTSNLGSTVGTIYPNWTRVGENVGRGATIEEINAALLASPSHAANIYGDFNLLGVGVYTNPGGVMWVTETFAKAVVTTARTVTTAPVASAPAPVVATAEPVVAPAASTVSGATGGSGKADRAVRSGAKARRASASASAMGAARGARGVPRQGPPEWAQNERSGR